MKRTVAIAALAVTSALALPCAPAALAATKIGSDCEAEAASAVPTLSQYDAAGAPVGTKAAGVVTAWKVTTSASVPQRTEALKVFNPLESGELEVVAESARETVLPGKTNEFQTRIPVAAGVRFGATSSAGVPYCSPGSFENLFYYFNTDPPVGTKSFPSGTNPGTVVALSVVVEPDVDGDGFGDETQDKCPQDALTAGACPLPPAPASLAITKTRLEGNTVAVQLKTSTAAAITVSGSVRGKPAANPSTVSVKPGETGRAYLALSKSIRERLAKLPRRQHLNLVIEAASAGATTVSSELALPGRKKKHSRHRHRHRR